MNGKSSPSSSSVTSSRDSGYPPQLSAVLEQSSVDMNHNDNDATDTATEDVDVIYCNAEEEESEMVQKTANLVQGLESFDLIL